MTNVIQKLIEWQAKGSQRTWTICAEEDQVVFIQLWEGVFSVCNATTGLEVKQARADVLAEVVEAEIYSIAEFKKQHQEQQLIKLEIRHGETCQKVPHTSEENPRGTGWFHSEEDDGPYYIATMRYCGRCHEIM